MQEAFDYIGSSRMLYDMQKGQFPVDTGDGDEGSLYLQNINLAHIHQFVELSQVGMRQDANSLWLHVDPDVRKNTKVCADSVWGSRDAFGGWEGMLSSL